MRASSYDIQQTPTRPPALVLFDIDGTLVRRAGPHHRQALVEAVRRVTGVETTTDHIPLHGMLDPDILSLMMGKAGIPDLAIRRSMPDVIRFAQYLYVRSCPDLQRKTCPGARALLERLEAMGILLGLVTGNLTRIGWKKLERCGLKPFFRFGAFGDQAKDRAGLVRIALRKCRAMGWIRRGTPVSLIGDAPADIMAAKANGVRSVAVYTGISGPGELAGHEPDLLIPDLRRLRPEWLVEGGRPRHSERE